jgi:hypothetical protein
VRVFKNRVLKGKFGPRWDEMIGNRRQMCNEELHNLYFSPYIIRKKYVHRQGTEHTQVKVKR